MTTEISAPYLHRYHEAEQSRLLSQGSNLEKYIYPFIDLTHVSQLLEVGCGVGAQTRILLRRFPHLKITAVDHAATQIETARRLFDSHPDREKVNFGIEDAGDLSFGDSQFEAAFLCWVLEHVKSPPAVLTEMRRVLKPEGIIYCTEVLNASLYTFPHCPKIESYWAAYNELQVSLGGDPFVGAKIADQLLAAGFTNVETNTISYHIDQRFDAWARENAYDYWKALFMSAAPQLMEAGKISQDHCRAMESEFDELRRRPNSIFFLVAMQARGSGSERNLKLRAGNR